MNDIANLLQRLARTSANFRTEMKHHYSHRDAEVEREFKEAWDDFCKAIKNHNAEWRA